MPLLDELKYLGHFLDEEHSLCDIHAQLDQIHGEVVNKGPKPGGEYGEVKFWHGHKNYTLPFDIV